SRWSRAARAPPASADPGRRPGTPPPIAAEGDKRRIDPLAFARTKTMNTPPPLAAARPADETSFETTTATYDKAMASRLVAKSIRDTDASPTVQGAEPEAKA